LGLEVNISDNLEKGIPSSLDFLFSEGKIKRGSSSPHPESDEVEKKGALVHPTLNLAR
jgi:hypothetical protein